MGESLVEAPPRETKMDESDAGLGVSVSFGRFGNDTLSWEKWSSFSQNRYLEEAGNLSTPGSVAKKKAYFEAHYKKIAAQKAMLSEEEKSDDPINEGALENSPGTEEKFDTRNVEKSEEEFGQDTYVTFLTNVVIDDEAKDDVCGSIRGCGDCLIDNTDFAEENKDTVQERNEEKLSGEGVELNADEEATPVAIEDLPSSMEAPQGNEDSRNVPTVLGKGSSKLSARDMAKKANTIKRDIMSIGTTKRIATPTVKKTSQASAPRYSRPTSVDRTKSVPHFSIKKVDESPVPKIKNFRVEGSKSLVLGDKDVVKRASKTFQNQFSGAGTNEKCGSLKQASSETFDPKISSSGSPGATKDNKGSQKCIAPMKKNATSELPFINLRSDERAEKRKEFLKNLKAKSITREMESSQVRARLKEQKEAEIRKLRQSLNFKATPLPSFYRARAKDNLQKECGDDKIRSQPQASNT